jgi:hypothetical protein
MIARFDHRPMLTALLALSMLITTAPPAATTSSESGGGNPPAAAVPGTGGEFYGEGWNNYGHDAVVPKPAQKGDSQTSDATERQEVGHP